MPITRVRGTAADREAAAGSARERAAARRPHPAPGSDKVAPIPAHRVVAPGRRQPRPCSRAPHRSCPQCARSPLAHRCTSIRPRGTALADRRPRMGRCDRSCPHRNDASRSRPKPMLVASFPAVTSDKIAGGTSSRITTSAASRSVLSSPAATTTSAGAGNTSCRPTSSLDTQAALGPSLLGRPGRRAAVAPIASLGTVQTRGRPGPGGERGHGGGLGQDRRTSPASEIAILAPESLGRQPATRPMPAQPAARCQRQRGGTIDHAPGVRRCKARRSEEARPRRRPRSPRARSLRWRP